MKIWLQNYFRNICANNRDPSSLRQLAELLGMTGEGAQETKYKIMNELMQNLNPEQLKAVLHKDGPLLIVAGAGTGKTTAITQKIAYLIEQGIAKSDEILALTFTEKAAGEMEERVDRLLPIGYLDLWISTFHSFAEKILKTHGIEIGLPGEFKLLNEFEQWILIQKNLGRFNLSYYRPLGNPTKFIAALVKHFSRLKDEDISPSAYLLYAEELKQNLDGMLGGGKVKKAKAQSSNDKSNPKPKIQMGDIGLEIEQQEVESINEVANAFHVYQQLLLESSALDFGDLINYTLKLFRERTHLLAKYREQFKYILVDEFQDTNWAQYELIKLLLNQRQNLIVVADDDQSIYRFRGASMSNILQLKIDYPQTKSIALVKNYRSKQNILDLAYNFIKLNNPNRLEHQLKVKKSKGESILSKKLIAQNKGKGEIEVLKGEDLAGEVRAVIGKIEELKKKDHEASWDDFAILVRANDHAKEFCSALEAQGLPYQFLASRGLYNKPVILDIIAYFDLLDDYHESRAMYRLLNLPVFAFSHLEIVNLNNLASRKAWSLFETLRSADALEIPLETKKKIHEVLSLLSRHAAQAREKSVGQILLAFLNDSGYLKHLTGLEERKSSEQFNYLNLFLKRIQKFEADSADKSVRAFLAELKMEIGSGEEGQLPADLEAGPEAIKILTVHGAKGLEFKYVFIVNLVDKRFPTTERKEQIAIPDALVKEILPEGDIHLEEERRLFYVGMTRAEEGLYFSWAPDYGGARSKKPSRFLTEIGLVEDMGITGSREFFRSGTPKFLGVPLLKKENDGGKVRQPEFRLPTYFSYTQLAAFSNCPYQYRFAHILRIPVRGKGVFSYGKTMHSTLQKLFELLSERRGLGQASLFAKAGEKTVKDPEIKLAELLELYEKNWQDDWFESKKQKEEYRKKGREALKIFFEKHESKWPVVLSTEEGFRLKVGGNGSSYTVQGRIDRIDKAGGKLKLIDYKTGSPKEKLTFEEKEQLLIYQLAATDIFRNEEVGTLAYYYLDDNSEVEFLGTAAELQKTKEKIIITIESIKTGEFPPRPSQLCRHCDFFEICEYRQN